MESKMKSEKARQEKLFQNIYNAASNAAGEDAADEMEKYTCAELLDKKFADELHIKLINSNLKKHVEHLASMFGFNLEKWIEKSWANNLQFYTEGLFLSKGELYSSIYGDICKAQNEALNCQS
jgi:hypothetical protein